MIIPKITSAMKEFIAAYYLRYAQFNIPEREQSAEVKMLAIICC